jgi:hypothetical protein
LSSLFVLTFALYPKEKMTKKTKLSGFRRRQADAGEREQEKRRRKAWRKTKKGKAARKRQAARQWRAMKRYSCAPRLRHRHIASTPAPPPE